MLAVETNIFPSKGECRKMIQANGLSVNKEKFTDANGVLGEEKLINGKYILVQKGKKNYFILKFN
jgi:tyrosyl-tRNA synthetase